MGKKISIYGLSGSGKTCYIYAMSQALSQGIELNDGELMTVITPNPRQMLKLYKNYDRMVHGLWPPPNDIDPIVYNFNVRKALKLLLQIDITDYRGGILDSLEEDDEDAQKDLFESYKDSEVLLFLFAADKVKAAINGDFEAKFNFVHFTTLYENYLGMSDNAKKTPVIIVMSKSDMLKTDEIPIALNFIKEQMPIFFGKSTGLTVGLTAVTLGRNLTNDEGELEGELDIRATAGNLSIPILFALYNMMGQRIEDTVGEINSALSGIGIFNDKLKQELAKSSFARFFNNNERSIRNVIQRHTEHLKEEQELLQSLNSSMAAIKDFLLKGAQIYIDGVQITN